MPSPSKRPQLSGQSTLSRCIFGNFKLTVFLVAFLVSATVVWQLLFLTFPYDGQSSADPAASIGTATSGRRCSLVKSRTFDRQKRFFKEKAEAVASNGTGSLDSKGIEKFILNKPCRYWGTLTTIFNPTEAVLTLPQDWCLVVAADRKGPTEYEVGPNTVLLSVEKQLELAKQFDLVNNLPWNHFARKNVAYLFAIMNKAEWIWDFDDDNILYGTPDVNSDIFAQGVLFEPSNKTTCGALNPYQWLENPPGGNTNTSFWPRGYPLELIKSPSCDAVSKCVVNEPNVGIFQAIADGDPDVDAIYRLTGALPVFFDKGTKEAPILVPNGMLSPMNAQAALVHVERASWSLFLPTTVHGRVSDIWRSYIAQAVGRFYGLQTAFLPDPLVRQDRNAHDYLADFNSEIPLYECAGAVVDLLNAWQALTMSSLPTALIELYIELYEYGVIESRDVDLIQHWLQSLSRVGYTFPPWHDKRGDFADAACSPFARKHTETSVAAAARPAATRRAKTYYSNVALVGQFNYESHPDNIVHWVQRWSEVFRVVSVCGPFSDETYHNVRSRGIDVTLYEGDAGYYSPVRNLGRSLVRFSSDPTIVGVMIAHDDMMVDLASLEQDGFPGNGNIYIQGPEPRAFVFSNHSTFWDNTTGTFLNISEYKKLATFNWMWWDSTLLTFSDALSRDRRSSQFVNASGLATLYTPGAGDFAYVPTKYAQTFHDMAEFLTDNKVFLEAAMATASLYHRDYHGANVSFVTTCTSWTEERFNPTKFVGDCRLRKTPREVYHAIKISIGLATWDGIFDSIIYSS